MVQPPFLKKHDTVAVVGVAGKVRSEPIREAVSILEKYLFNVKISKHLFEDYFRFSSTLENRLHDFQTALDDPMIKAIFIARGGYGSAQLIDAVDWTLFKKSPKWIIGFSDITALLMHVNTLDIMSIHGVMPVLFGNEKYKTSFSYLIGILSGEKIEILAPHHPENRMGNTIAPAIGGNLSILTSIIGTTSDKNYEGNILFLEEIGEPLYKIDRMLVQLSRSNKLDNIKGIVVGQFTNMSDDLDNIFGSTIEELIKHYSPKDIPIAFNAPIGHEFSNYPVVLGMDYLFQVNEGGMTFSPLKN